MAVSLANDRGAGQFLCDEFNRIAFVHASLAGHAAGLLDEMSAARSWTRNAYVGRACELLERQ